MNQQGRQRRRYGLPLVVAAVVAGFGVALGREAQKRAELEQQISRLEARLNRADEDAKRERQRVDALLRHEVIGQPSTEPPPAHDGAANAASPSQLPPPPATPPSPTVEGAPPGPQGSEVLDPWS
jgi:hypothetical protein